MKPTLSRFFVLLLFITFLTITSASPTGAQPPEPPEIMENGEYPSNADSMPSITDRRETTVNGVENNVNAATAYWSISGATFVPSTNLINYFYGGDGCVDTGASGNVWRGSVNLPHGSTITGLYFNFRNEVNDPPDSTLYLRRHRFNGGYDDILYTSGNWTGIGIFSSVDEDVIYNTGTVDNWTYSYNLVWNGNPDQKLCSVNISYTPPPLFLNALPLINR